MRIRVARVFLACVMLAGCGGGGETAREGPINEQAESGSERTFSGTVPEGVTVGRTTVDRPSPEERGRSEARLLECQIEVAGGGSGPRGAGRPRGRDGRRARGEAGRGLRAAPRRARLHL
ncbi:MAG TPA: hypothetical protein VKA51_10580, partial [Rubrobacteraceae bacterium]|nr:hypothetical protein [Rubrobacteraceae bacterium]